VPSITITCSCHLNYMQCAIPFKVIWLFPHISNFVFKICFPISYMFIHTSIFLIDVLIVLVVSCLLNPFGQLPIFDWIGFGSAI